MDDLIQKSLKHLIENRASPEQIEQLCQALTHGQIFFGGKVQDTVIFAASGDKLRLTDEALERLAIAYEGRIPSPLHQLPQAPADFVGREKELRLLLKKTIDAQGGAIINVTGIGGVGKTALSLLVAQQLAEQYSDAQFFIELGGSTKNRLQPLDVIKQVIQSFYPTTDLSYATETELIEAYQSTLAEKKALLFLDDANEASQITPLLPPATCCVFITSREKLGIPKLNYLNLDILKEQDAIQLLRELCPRISEIDAHQIASYCGYLPLALRLAAGFMRVHIDLSSKEYIIQITKRVKSVQVLHSSEGDSISIEPIYYESYEQLSKNEQRYWSMLLAFPAAFKRDALSAVWGLDDEKTNKLARKLCQYGFLEDDAKASRYRVHNLLLKWAGTKITKADQSNAFLNHLRHYRDVWHTAEQVYNKGGDNILQGLFLYDMERPQIERAHQWAVENLQTNHEILKILKEIPETVYLLRTRLHPSQQISWFEAALESAKKLEDRYNQNKLLGNIGTAYGNLGDERRAIQFTEKALAVAREIGDRQREGFWLGNLGASYNSLGEMSRAIEYYEQAFAIAREVDDRKREAMWLSHIGSAYDSLGETHHAIEYYEQALMISREVDDRKREGECLGFIGSAYSNLGESRRAIEYLEQALAISREIGDRQYEGNWLGNIAVTYGNLGELRPAMEYTEQALALAREIGDRQREGFWLGNVGAVYDALGESRRAIEYLEEALAISREIGNRRDEGASLGSIGTAYGNLGESRRAIEYQEEALAISREIGDRQREGFWLGNVGAAYNELGEPRRAIEYQEEALAISREIGDRQLEDMFLGFIGSAYGNLGESRRAIEYLEQALAISREIGDRQYEGEWLNAFGKIYINLDETSRALKFINEALVIAKDAGFRRMEGISFLHLATIYQLEQQNELALKAARKAKEILESIEAPELQKAMAIIKELEK